MSSDKVRRLQWRGGKRAFRAGGRGSGEVPRYPTHDTFDRRGFLARLGLGLLAAGAACVDREVVPHGDFRWGRDWGPGGDGVPWQPDARRDLIPDQPQGLNDTMGVSRDMQAPLDGHPPSEASAPDGASSLDGGPEREASTDGSAEGGD